MQSQAAHNTSQADGSVSSGGSASSSSTTVNNTQHSDANHDANPTAEPSSSSLFNADEAQFMQDSFSSAETFDPFTVGAPGYKVPNVLPANLGGMGAAPGRGERNGTGSPGRLSTGTGSNSATQTALEGGANSSRGGGYGQDKSWQMQQLQALQAERYKYMVMRPDLSHQQHSSMPSYQRSSSLAGPSTLPDTSTIGKSLLSMGWSQSRPMELESGMGQLASFGDVMAQQQRQQQQQQQQQQQSHHQQQQQPQHHIAPSGGLGSLGAYFPSSHQFPNHAAALAHHQQQQQLQQQQQQQMGRIAPFPGGTGHDITSVPHSANGGPPAMQGWGDTAPPALQDVASRFGEGPSKATSKVVKAKGTSGAAHTMANPDAPYVFEPAPRPPDATIDVERIRQAGVIPAPLQEAYFSPDLPRVQPHLVTLREEQLLRKEQGLSANIRKDKKDAVKGARAGGGDDDGDSDGATGGKKKQPHVLLTEAEKKANHIASEQKRRANIRKGYEMLTTLVPSLREGLDEDGDGGGGGGDDDDDEDDEDDGGGGNAEDGDTKRGKKRRAGDGDSKLESKSGPRSEAIILMKAVDYIRTQIDEHHALVTRKQELQRQLAQRYGADDGCLTAPPP